MMGVEPAGQRSERRHDDLRGRRDEAAARDMPSFELKTQLRMKMAGDFHASLVAHRLVAEDDPSNLNLVIDSSAAMISKAGIVVADDPGPIELCSERGQKVASVGGKPVTAELVVKAIAQAKEPLRSSALDLSG